MDIALLRTFLEVSATGSFVAAAERLYVTQSAVSLRIQRLEAELGQPLFVRSRAGAVLNSAGKVFEQYALSLVSVWEIARQQVAIPEGYTRNITIGAQYSLWHRLGFRWIDAMQEKLPDLSVRAELGMPDRLTRYLAEGVVHAALLYQPTLRPSLQAKLILKEKLVLVSASAETRRETLGENYVFVDWGPEFVEAHALHLPGLTNPGLSLALGTLSRDYILRRGLSAYLPARAVKEMVDAGDLHIVPDAPAFPYPAWLVWREDIPDDLLEVVMQSIEDVGRDAGLFQDSLGID